MAQMKINLKQFQTGIIYSSLVLFFLFLFSGCSGISVADTPKRTYLLDIPLPPIPPVNPNGKTLLVSIPNAAPGFDTPAQLYIRHQNVLEYYSKSQWVDTPARMLLPLLVLRIEATGHFAAILSAATSPVAGEIRLDTEIVRLYQDFLSEPSQVILMLRVQLLDMVARQVIATKVFKILSDAATTDAQGGMMATNEAVTRVLNEIAGFVVKQVE
ncbi:MAG: hypothetical protein DRQ49_14560 [Gammaproteobacteria bacterium]|nr:MAG: hypothetical protein DRQ49_14560 [Gammaproteobacteria bacterium]RKZ72791.1 MAG: hypothetical protein DRQ57_16385 [Gammaproteobacteria bacterium]